MKHSGSLQIRQELLGWYDKNHRVLPWRRNPHSTREPKANDKYQSIALDTPQQQFAYCVWVCEVMSQQTQVLRVAKYFTRWIQKWPTVQVKMHTSPFFALDRMSWSKSASAGNK